MAVPPPKGWPTFYDPAAREAGFDSWQDWCDTLEAERKEKGIKPVEICGIMSRRRKEPCRGPQERYNRCSWHGAHVPPAIKTGVKNPGSRSRHLPRRIVEDFEHFLNDPEYQSLREEIAVLKVREQELLVRLDHNESSRGWTLLKKLSNQLVQAVVSGDGEEIVSLSDQISEVVTNNKRIDENWKELRAVENEIRRMKLAESQIKRNRDMVLDKDRAIILILWLMEIVRSRVKDPEPLREIGIEVRRRLGAPDLINAVDAEILPQ